MARPSSKPAGPTCAKCGDAQEPRTVNVVIGTCWRCHRPMKIAFGTIGENGGVALSPGSFTATELEAARKAGAKLEVRHSRTTNSDYLANVCPGCDQITGDHFLHDFWQDAKPETEVSRTMDCISCSLDGDESQV